MQTDVVSEHTLICSLGRCHARAPSHQCLRSVHVTSEAEEMAATDYLVISPPEDILQSAPVCGTSRSLRVTNVVSLRARLEGTLGIMLVFAVAAAVVLVVEIL